MEKFMPHAKALFEDSVQIKANEKDLVISIIVKSENKLKGAFANKTEVNDMLRMFGGLNEDIAMEIDIDEESQKIDLKFQDKNNYIKVRDILDNFLERIIDICNKALAGDISHFRDLGDFSD
ncbi:MAG: hypothetical protein EU540_05110 [Promethearchaeota archaeon]|nr:MAG: hypothetical protein EU540_05110 [Candidatus Lokiarchaeota archaeon]